IIDVCTQAAQGQVVAAVNFNAPGQVVIAGHKTAVDRAIIQAKAAGAKRALILPISVPVHCSLMHPAAERMAERLTQVTIYPPKIPIIHNVDVSTHSDLEAIRNALSAQIDHPVRWVETIEMIANNGVTQIFECGPGKVLAGLTKRIVKDLTALPLVDTQTVANALHQAGI
ncbi:MAG: malonyl CoA-acyl carrier protein transacylase, partial [Beggiatoa sp. IS2]